MVYETLFKFGKGISATYTPKKYRELKGMEVDIVEPAADMPNKIKILGGIHRTAVSPEDNHPITPGYLIQDMENKNSLKKITRYRLMRHYFGERPKKRIPGQPKVSKWKFKMMKGTFESIEAKPNVDTTQNP